MYSIVWFSKQAWVNIDKKKVHMIVYMLKHLSEIFPDKDL